jgi:hypothetical protein
MQLEMAEYVRGMLSAAGAGSGSGHWAMGYAAEMAALATTHC